MKSSFLKECSNFKPINCPDSLDNKKLNVSCENCLYFSSKNCGKNNFLQKYYESEVF